MAAERPSLLVRLLRGRLLYVLIGLAGFLYLRALVQRIGEPIPPPPVVTPGPLEWWPKELDASALERAAERKPGLAVALSLLTVLFGGFAFSGIGLTLWALGTGQLGSFWRFVRRRLPSWSLGELGRIVMLILSLVILLPLARHLVLPSLPGDTRAWMAVSMLCLDAAIVLMIGAFAAAKGRSFGDLLGLGRRRLGAALAAGLRSYIGIFPWLFLLLFLMIELSRRIGWQPPTEPIQELLFQERRGAVLAITVALACVVAPVAEELFFRGVVYGALRQRIAWPAAMLISAGIFAAIHTNLLGFLSILLLGCLLANLYERTGALVVPIAIHILHNSLLMAMALTFRQLLLAGRE